MGRLSYKLELIVEFGIEERVKNGILRLKTICMAKF